jgi:hypothetical protein
MHGGKTCPRLYYWTRCIAVEDTANIAHGRSKFGSNVFQLASYGSIGLATNAFHIGWIIVQQVDRTNIEGKMLSIDLLYLSPIVMLRLKVMLLAHDTYVLLSI